MATAQAVLTLDHFLSMPDSEADGTHYELSEGELITLAAPGFRHGAIMMNVGYLLRAALDHKQYIVVCGDTGFILKSDATSATIRGADVAVCTRESMGANVPIGRSPQPPLLAVEVISPSNTAVDLDLKVKQYLSAGTQEVWLLFPDTRRLYVYLNTPRSTKVFEENESFESILGTQFQVDQLFEV